MGIYRRTVSFPNPIPKPTSKPKSYHVRSVSLPCGRTHPLIPQLRDEITELRAWAGSGDGAGSARLVNGLARLKSVLDSLDDVLQLPQTQDSLSTQNDIVERLLEDFLKYVDVYEVFHSSMLGLKQEVSSAQMGIRRKDDSKLGLYVKAHKKIAGDVGKLITTVGSIRNRSDGGGNVADFHDELSGVIRDVHGLIASVSEAVFGGVAGSYGPGRRPGWAGLGLRKVRKEGENNGIEEFVKVLGGVENFLELKKKKNNNICNKENKNNNNNNNNNEEVRMEVLKKMEEMEDCVGEMERESERVFRSLISNRVSLLNILTHA
ncbi:hypothetical protein RND81_03G013300 [Saponaria officinalis]|uniref:Uncharacterized protein n=1 Tax=Saponaria officinalis TaxID=3572 RepID=A0AAW1LXU4_SAPOF